MSVDRELALRMYQMMVRVRTFDEELGKLSRANKVRGLYYAQHGQEAAAAALGACLQPRDYIMTTYRGNGDQVAAGADMRRMAAEIFGRSTGYCKGKGGVMHIAASDIGVLAATGIVGGGLPIAAGAAFSAQVRGSSQVTFCTFGDGASNQGTFHESLNIAALWKLPVVYLCYNNQYAEGTARRLHQSIDKISTRAVGYGIPGHTVDGMDPEVVYDAVAEAAARARRGEGPSLIEAVCYRYSGHFVGDQMVYVPKDEMEAWRKRDPLAGYERRLRERGWIGDAAVDEIARAAREEVAGAIAFAEVSPEPDVSELTTDVYAPSTPVPAGAR